MSGTARVIQVSLFRASFINYTGDRLALRNSERNVKGDEQLILGRGEWSVHLMAFVGRTGPRPALAFCE